MIEIWKDIKDYVGYYQVSNIGKVRSVDRLLTYSSGQKNLHKGRVLILRNNHRGYPMAMLSKKDAQRCIAVHRLVATTFIENPDSKPEVNHISGNKEDNTIHNLEWNTREENEHHAKVNGLKPRGSKHKNSKLKEGDILDIRSMYPSHTYKSIGLKYNVTHRTIWDVVNLKTWRHLDA